MEPRRSIVPRPSREVWRTGEWTLASGVAGFHGRAHA